MSLLQQVKNFFQHQPEHISFEEYKKLFIGALQLANEGTGGTKPAEMIALLTTSPKYIRNLEKAFNLVVSNKKEEAYLLAVISILLDEAMKELKWPARKQEYQRIVEAAMRGKVH
ncbi:hypothetical protein HYV86_00110 [Candidatus Woesearchaeota archaeon]|nr:hypothetical protein [Candidatus Woesearchaeota archaeon]